MRILLAADGFVTPRVLREALDEHQVTAEIVEIQSSWPVTPFGTIADVKEACGDEDELIAALEGVDIAFTHTYPFSERVIANSSNLKMITVCRGGPVNVNLEAATKHGVVVTFAPGRNARATAEHSVAMIMAAARSIAQRDAELKAGKWRGDLYLYDEAGLEIGSSTVGLIGFGAVGSRVAKIMQTMGATVVVYDPYATACEEYEFVELRELLERADIISLHARATDENRHMINADSISAMKSGAILVNCARGSLVDSEAVCDALDSGKLTHFALDCLPEEPLPSGHSLLGAPNVTMTPHIAGASKEAAHIAARIGAADIAAFIAGDMPKFVANQS